MKIKARTVKGRACVLIKCCVMLAGKNLLSTHTVVSKIACRSTTKDGGDWKMERMKRTVNWPDAEAASITVG